MILILAKFRTVESAGVFAYEIFVAFLGKTINLSCMYMNMNMSMKQDYVHESVHELT